jgi:hypothetical protein
LERLVARWFQYARLIFSDALNCVVHALARLHGTFRQELLALAPGNDCLLTAIGDQCHMRDDGV